MLRRVSVPLRPGACVAPAAPRIAPTARSAGHARPASRPALDVAVLVARRYASATRAKPAAEASAEERPKRRRARPPNYVPMAEKRREAREILLEYGLPEDSLPASRRVSPDILRVVLDRFKDWGMALNRQPTALRRWQFLHEQVTPAEYLADLDLRIKRLQDVLLFSPQDVRRMLVRDARVLWTSLEAVKSRVDFYRGLLGSDLLCKVVLRNPPLLTIDRPRERAAFWKTRLNLSDTEAPRLLKHSAIMNCTPEWCEVRLRLVTNRVGGDHALVRAMLLNHGDMLLLSEANLNSKFDLLDGVLDRAAYAHVPLAGALAMFLTRSMKTTIMPRFQRMKEAGVGFARDDVTFFDYFVRTEAIFYRVLNRCLTSPLYLASRQISSAIMQEKPSITVPVHPNLLFPNRTLNQGVHFCIKQQLENEGITLSTVDNSVEIPQAKGDSAVMAKYLIQKQAHRRLVLVRSSDPMLTFLPAP